MNCLVLYHSKYGQTEKIAERIAAALESKQVHVEVKHIDQCKKHTSSAKYDCIVIGASDLRGETLPRHRALHQNQFIRPQ